MGRWQKAQGGLRRTSQKANRKRQMAKPQRREPVAWSPWGWDSAALTERPFERRRGRSRHHYTLGLAGSAGRCLCGLRQSLNRFTFDICLLTCSSCLLPTDPLLAVKVRPQSLRNDDRAIGLLVIFDDREPGPSDGQAAAIESVEEFRLA